MFMTIAARHGYRKTNLANDVNVPPVLLQFQNLLGLMLKKR